jgi:hypothetical protein
MWTKARLAGEGGVWLTFAWRGSTAGLRVDASVLLMVDIAVFLVLVTCLLGASTYLSCLCHLQGDVCACAVRIFLGGGSSAKTDAALLLGLPDSGKTSLFTQVGQPSRAAAVLIEHSPTVCLETMGLATVRSSNTASWERQSRRCEKMKPFWMPQR